MPENDSPQITVVTVHYNSFEFVRLMYESFIALTQNKFRMLVCDNGSRLIHKNRLCGYFESRKDVELVFREQGRERASFAHARALDLLLSQVKTEYALVMDSDCVLLAKDWDRLMVDTMRCCEIIGTTSDKEHAGARIGGGTFPLPFAMFLRVRTFRSLGVSFMPGEVAQGQDTAWQLKEAYTKRGLSSCVFDGYNTRTFRSGPFARLEGIQEYYYQGKLIASHFGRGSSGGLAKYFTNNPMNPFFNIFRWFKGQVEMRSWMAICRKIVADQMAAS
jgi:hypothetical protein